MDADLVLVHGFWSSPATWDRLIPRMRDDPELTGLRIHAFGYESPKLRWPGSPVRIPDYDDIAQSLPAYLAAHAPGTSAIAIVTHSQGGLILQRFLAWMLTEGRGRELIRLRLAVMLSCPNEGAEYLRSVRAAIGFGHHPQAGQLDVLSREVGEARRIVLRQVVNAASVDDRHCPIPVYVYSGRSDNVVRRESAQSVFPSAEVLPGNHFSILDPDAQGNLTEPTLRRHLLETLTPSTPADNHARAGRMVVGQAAGDATQSQGRVAGSRLSVDMDGTISVQADDEWAGVGTDRSESLTDAVMDTQIDLEDASTHSRPTIAPQSKPVPAYGIDAQDGPATQTEVQANAEGLPLHLEERPSEHVAGLEAIAKDTEWLEEQRFAKQDQFIEAVKADPSYEHVAAALNEAFVSGAISEDPRLGNNGFRVRVGHPLDGMRLTFVFTIEMTGSRFLQIGTWSPQKDSTNFSMSWRPSNPIGAVFDSLRKALAEARMAVNKEEFDVLFALQNLVQSLNISIQARRGQRRRPSGKVIEIVDDRWAFTETGLESLTDNFSLPESDFPKRRPFSKYGVDPKKYQVPQAPPNVNQSDWDMLMLVAENTYPWAGRYDPGRPTFT